MNWNIIYLFVASFLISFIGTLPLGPINLSVVETTLKEGRRAASFLSLAASILEMGQVFIALYCSWWFADLLSYSDWTKWAAVLLFILIGLFFWLKKEKKKDQKVQRVNEKGAFLKGVVLGILNPQAVPFWFFVLSSLNSTDVLNLNFQDNVFLIFLFLLAAGIGKFASLSLFAAISKLVEKQAAKYSEYLNKIIGGVLIGIGLIQAIGLFFKSS